MSIFIMFGTYTTEAMDDISSDRTQQAVELVEKVGGKVRSIYALLGEPDLIIIADLPSAEAAMQTSIALTKATGISFTTTQGVEVANFDNLFS